MEEFVERKLRFLDGKARYRNSTLLEQEKESSRVKYECRRADLEKISINPMLIDKIRIPKAESPNAVSVPTSDTTVVCKKSLVDRIMIKSLAYNLSTSVSFEDSSRRCSISTGRGRFSQTAERLRNSLATQALNDRMTRDGHHHDPHLVCRLAEALSGPASITAQQLAAEESQRQRASRPSSSAKAVRIEAVAALVASREALSDFYRVLPPVD
jgi:hypothetical protein